MHTPIPKKCGCCKQRFMARKPYQKYCTLACAGKMRRRRKYIMKICDFCNREFPVRYKERQQECCSHQCAGKLRAQRAPKIRHTRICAYCRAEFVIKYASRKVVCCSVSCARKLRWSNKEWRAKVCEKIRASRTAESWARSSKKLKQKWADPKFKRRRQALGFSRGRPTEPQKMLGKVLPDGWSMEYSINLKRTACPRTYSVDWGNPYTKTAIEVDGPNHQSNVAQIARDRRKECTLRRRGWTVLRITNAEVRRMFEKVS